jgi:hypothetical protein
MVRCPSGHRTLRSEPVCLSSVLSVLQQLNGLEGLPLRTVQVGTYCTRDDAIIGTVPVDELRSSRNHVSTIIICQQPVRRFLQTDSTVFFP